MFNLYDYKGDEVNPEDILKSENLATGKVKYYLCGNKMMYLYNEQGTFQHDSFMNLKLDYSVTLINDERHRWTRLGKESEVYDSLFYMNS